VSIDFDDDLSLPPALAALAVIGFDTGYNHETDELDFEGVDFEPFDEFLDPDDTTDWFRSWTGNTAVDGDAFRVFGQDGTGGYAAFWLVREDQPLADQPIVFLGSEGEMGVVAADLSAFLWLVADGSGPREAVEHPKRASRPIPELSAVAEKYAGGARRSAREVIVQAKDEFPDFEEGIEELTR
jgi:hypothetical protein